MKKDIYIKTSLRSLAFLLLCVTLLSSCAKDPAPVLYDLYKDKGTGNPVVTGITPADSAWAGYDVITITGQNFLTSTDTAKVYFDNALAAVVEVNPTQIKVKAPNLPKDELMIRILTRTSSATNQPAKYKLKEIMPVFKSYTFQEEPRSMAFDKEGNLFVSLTVSSGGVGVKKISKTGVMTDYAPKGSETYWSGMKWAYGSTYGANGTLIAARPATRALFKINPGTAPSTYVTADASLGAAFNDFDLDPNGNIWAAGTGKYIFKIKPDKSIVPYANFAATSSKITAVRVYKDKSNNVYVYVAGTKDGQEGIWRYKLDANQDINAANGEKVLDFTAKYPGKVILGLTFTEDGEMYVGTDDIAVVLVVKTDNTIAPLLPGVLLPKFFAMTFGNNEPYLYLSREKLTTEKAEDKVILQKLFKAYVFKKGAPYYGLTL